MNPSLKVYIKDRSNIQKGKWLDLEKYFEGNFSKKKATRMSNVASSDTLPKIYSPRKIQDGLVWLQSGNRRLGLEATTFL